MSRLDAMLERLPPIYNIGEGGLLRQVMALFAGALAAFDEDMDRVRRSHWVDTAAGRDDLERIGALFEVPAAPWEPDHFYRLRLKATIAARLHGAVTRDVLEGLLVSLLDGAQQALGVRYLEIPQGGRRAGAFLFSDGEDPTRPAFVEFPRQRQRSAELVQARGLLPPLAKLVLTNRGLHPVPLLAKLRGVAPRRTAVPVLVNLTTAQVLTYVGDLPCGHELALGVAEDGTLAARRGDDDVGDRMFSGDGFVPGADFTPVVPHPEPRPLTLARGDNELWFFPLALFDERVLSTGVYGMPMTDLRHGRYGTRAATIRSTASDATPDGTVFDRSLFEQPPAISLDLWWDEARPAAFRFEIPTGAVRRQPGTGDPEADHERLFGLLQQTVSLLRAAAVDGRVTPRPFADRQPLTDRVRVFDPNVGSEEMRTESRLIGLSALFDTSTIDGARFD